MDKQDQILEKLEKMEKFMFQHLVTKQELSELADKVGLLTESVNNLTTTVANLAKQVHDYGEEHASIKHQLLIVQDWIRKAADKVGIEFKL
ncbi:MAG: hypothetical protein AAB410_03145 [Patescibacteria group bacterium]